MCLSGRELQPFTTTPVPQVAAGVQVRLHQPAVSAGHQGVAQRRGHHLSGRVRVPAQVPEQVRHILSSFERSAPTSFNGVSKPGASFIK